MFEKEFECLRCNKAIGTIRAAFYNNYCSKLCRDIVRAEKLLAQFDRDTETAVKSLSLKEIDQVLVAGANLLTIALDDLKVDHEAELLGLTEDQTKALYEMLGNVNWNDIYGMLDEIVDSDLHRGTEFNPE